MVDGVLLLVDALDGPMPQTRFVLKKSLALGLKPIVVINKIDRPNCNPDATLDKVFSLFMELDATDQQLDFPVIYAVGREGWATYDLNVKNHDLTPLFDTILKYVPGPVAAEGSLRMLVTMLDYSSYTGRIGIGRVMAACVPGGILSFTFLSFFIGLASYTNAFVAQYFGSGNREKISESVWQGIWLAVFSWLFMLLSIPLGLLIINSAGHDPAVSVLERQYFTVLTVPSLFSLLACPLAAFYTGRGRTLIVMAANIAGNAVCVLMS